VEKQFKLEGRKIYKQQALTTAEIYEELQRLVVQLNKAHSHIEMLKQSRLETISFLADMVHLVSNVDIPSVNVIHKLKNKIYELEGIGKNESV